MPQHGLVKPRQALADVAGVTFRALIVRNVVATFEVWSRTTTTQCELRKCAQHEVCDTFEGSVAPDKRSHVLLVQNPMGIIANCLAITLSEEVLEILGRRGGEL